MYSPPVCSAGGRVAFRREEKTLRPSGDQSGSEAFPLVNMILVSTPLPMSYAKISPFEGREYTREAFPSLRRHSVGSAKGTSGVDSTSSWGGSPFETSVK